MKTKIKELLLQDYKTTFDPLKIYIKYEGFYFLQKYNKLYCGCCGKKVVSPLRGICNHCGSKNLFDSRIKSKYYGSMYYNLTNVVENNLLIRTFVLRTYECVGEEHTKVTCDEVMRAIYTEDHKMLFCRKATINAGFYYWDWKYDSKLKIANYNRSRQSNMVLYNFAGRKPSWLKYFDFDWLKQLNDERKYHGLTHAIYNINDLLQQYFKEPQFMETMFKLKRFDLYLCYIHNPELKNILWDVMRHNKKIPTGNHSDWCRYLNSCITLNKDVKNMSIVIPDNFERKMEALDRKIKREKLKDQLDHDKQYQIKYDNHISEIPAFEKNNMKLIPIKKIEDFFEYGEIIFHNCLFQRKYYLKNDSYCFVVFVDNEPTECCEITTLDGTEEIEINQLYGKYNGVSEYHDEIKLFVNEKLDILKNEIFNKGENYEFA